MNQKEYTCAWLVGVVFEKHVDISNRRNQKCMSKHEGPTTKGQTNSEVAFSLDRQTEYHVEQNYQEGTFALGQKTMLH